MLLNHYNIKTVWVHRYACDIWAIRKHSSLHKDTALLMHKEELFVIVSNLSSEVNGSYVFIEGELRRLSNSDDNEIGCTQLSQGRYMNIRLIQIEKLN